MTWILVVEDDLYVRRLVERVLRDDGLHVRGVASGGEALALLDREQPDVVVLDLTMPIMDGATFLRNARDAGLSSTVLILASPGSGLAAEESADFSLEKPFDPVRLSTAVRALINRTPSVC